MFMLEDHDMVVRELNKDKDKGCKETVFYKMCKPMFCYLQRNLQHFIILTSHRVEMAVKKIKWRRARQCLTY